MGFNKILVLLSLSLFPLISILSHQTHAQDVYPGYVFYGSGKNCYLYDNNKTLLHTWTSSVSAGASCRLMRDSSVMFNGKASSSGWTGQGALPTGRFQIIKWDGTVFWDFQYASSAYMPHHNIELVYKTDDPKEVPNLLCACYTFESGSKLMVDKVVEIKRTGATTGEIVWEWHSWEHRTTSGNDKPELLDSSSSIGMMNDWTHLNSISYNPALDQVVFGLKHFYEFIIIDHSTTTAQSSSHTGGKYGKGGDILYRWGQASNYGMSGSDFLKGFHSARWVPNIFLGTNLTVPGAGNVVMFSNDTKQVLEVQPPGNGDGVYPRTAGQAYGPSQPLWVKSINPAGMTEGSIQKLPNGNYFICNNQGSIYELAPSGTTVWTMSASALQSLKYPLTYFDNVTPVKENSISGQKIGAPKIFTNPATGSIIIAFDNSKNSAEVTICNINGKKLFHGAVYQENFTWNTKNNSTGVYIITVETGGKIFNRCINLMK